MPVCDIMNQYNELSEVAEKRHAARRRLHREIVERGVRTFMTGGVDVAGAGKGLPAIQRRRW